MGGEIGVMSRPGQGSTFWFVVPLPPAVGEAPRQNGLAEATGLCPQARDTLLKGRRVLLAEDNHVNRMFVQEILRRAGVECHAVENGLQAIEAAQCGRFDLVLMDCQMPEMDGFEATRHIREMEGLGQLPGHVPIIALTANAIKGDRERCLEAGMDDYIGKPFEPDALLKMIGRLLAADESEPAEGPPAGHEPAPSPPDEPAADGSRRAGGSLPGEPGVCAESVVGFRGGLAGESRSDRPARPPARRPGHGRIGPCAERGRGHITAESLQALAAEIEAAGKAGDLAEAAPLADRLSDEADRCLRFIPELRMRMNAS